MDNIISFLNKAKDKGVEIKTPPKSLAMQSKQLIEHDSEDIEVFEFEADQDFVTLKVYRSSQFFVFEFRDKETKSLYRKYEIDLQTFYYMELALHSVDNLLRDL